MSHSNAGPARTARLASVRLVAICALAVLWWSGTAHGQSVVELRGATTEYRFVDFLHTFENRFVSDVLYLGAPGADELYLGLGRQLRPASGLTLTPILYLVVGKQNDELGVAPALSLFYDGGGTRVLAFAGRFSRLDGGVPSYWFLDSLDVTRVFGQWELGASGGFLRSGDAWNELVGPTLKLNDKRGSTAAALRFGYTTEFRLIRIFTF